jgi:hypothetical protein
MHKIKPSTAKSSRVNNSSSFSKPLSQTGLIDQKRIKEAFGMDNDHNQDFSKENFSKLVQKFYEARAKETRPLTLVLLTSNIFL